MSQYRYNFLDVYTDLLQGGGCCDIEVEDDDYRWMAAENFLERPPEYRVSTVPSGWTNQLRGDNGKVLGIRGRSADTLPDNNACIIGY